MAQNTQTLAARLARGEEAAFADLYDACADRLHHYLTGHLGSADRAADVLQSTFVRAVQSRRQFAHVENPIAYLFQIARNEATRAAGRELRHNAKQLTTDDWEPAVASSCSLEDVDVVATALARLKSADRELIELKLFANLTFAEIAQITGDPTATVATRYRRALESLRPWLARQYQ